MIIKSQKECLTTKKWIN